LQCGAVCCSVLQCVAVCCSVLQCVAVCCSVLQCVAVCHSWYASPMNLEEYHELYCGNTKKTASLIRAKGSLLSTSRWMMMSNKSCRRHGSTSRWVMSNIVLQCVAVCCSVLQSNKSCHLYEVDISHRHTMTGRFAAACCSVLQCAVCCSVLQCVAVCCTVLQCVAGVLQYVAGYMWRNGYLYGSPHCSAPFPFCRYWWQFLKVSCNNTLQHTATHCNTLQHTATHCNTMQHNATHYPTLAVTSDNSRKSAATRCNTLQHTAKQCNTLPYKW